MDKLKSLVKKIQRRERLIYQPFFRTYNSPLSPSIVNRVILISHQYQYSFSRIFKSANSTVVASLYNAESAEKINSLDEIQQIKDNYFAKPADLNAAELQKLRSYYKFTIVRNPYSRTLSAYLDKVKRLGTDQRTRVTGALGKEADAPISFDEFLYYLENGGLQENAHWAPQNELMTFPIGEMSFVGKTENLQKHFSLISRQIFGENMELINAREHKTGAKELYEDLPDSELMRIYRLYEKDFTVFKYVK